MTQETSSQDRAVYQDLRERLVDRSKRNRLLNFRHTPSAPIIRIVDEVPERVLAQLRDDTRFRFRPLPDPRIEPEDEQTPEFEAALQRARLDPAWQAAMAAIDADDPTGMAAQIKLERDLRDQIRALLKLPRRPRSKDIDPAAHARANGIAPEFDLPNTREQSKRTGTNLQTLLFPDQLKTRITRIYRNSRAIEQETGVNTLHLAIGFLEWFEADSSSTALLSPLLVLPVALERRTVRGGENEYRLSALDSSPATNLSLELRLRDDFALKFPEFDPDGADPVENYLDAVRQMIRIHPRWRVRRFVTLASFSFARIAMYRDLDPANWTKIGPVESHPLVRPILRGTSADPDAGIGTFAQEYDIDSPAIETIAPVLVHDADSSQHSAIIDAMKGRSFVIEGPPGTGKSQTIANLIAAFIHRGKSVLFVSEKMAALEVVKSRLDKVDLGDFCLTLHSTGAKPATVIEALKRRAERRAPRPPSSAQAATHIAWAKAEMASHLRALHAAIGPNEETAHALIGRYTEIERKHPEFPSLFREKPGGLPTAIDGTQAAVARQRLETLEAAAWPGDRPGWRPGRSPFNVLSRTSLFPDEQQDLLRSLDEIPAPARALSTLGVELAAFVKETEPNTIQAIRSLKDRVDKLSDPGPNVDLALAARLTNPDAITAAQALSAAAAEAGQLHARLTASGITDPASVPPEKLAALARLAEVLEVKRATVGDLPAIAAQISYIARTMDDHASIIAHLTNLLGIERATSSTLSAACMAAELASHADPMWRPHFRPGLHNHALALGKAASRQEAWQSRVREVSDLMAVQDFNTATARHLAATLKNAGWLGILKSEVRDARKRFAQIWRGGARPRVAAAVQHLETMVEVLEERDALAADPAIRIAMPSSFDLASTDLRPIALAASWQFRVEDALPGDTVDTVRVRTTLLNLDQTRFSSVAALAGPAASLRGFLDRGQLTTSVTWDEAKRTIDTRLSGMLDLISAVGAIGLDSGLLSASLDDLSDVARRWHDKNAELTSPSARALFNGSVTLPFILQETVTFVSMVFAAFPSAAENLLVSGWHGSVSTPRVLSSAIGDKLTAIDQTLERLKKLGLYQFASDALEQPMASLIENTEKLLAVRTDLPHFLQFASARADCLKNPLSKTVVDAFEAKGVDLLSLQDALDWMAAWILVREAAGAEREVYTRSGIQLDTLRRNFAQSDRTQLGAASIEVAIAAHRARVPPGSSFGSRKEWTDGALLQNEFGKQRRHVPLRDLLGRAGGAVTALAPCIMMSPLTVAQYLRPGRLVFDLVVMDEASQIKPEDAVGALLRARQTVIVGDPKQLPPTNFFDRALDDDAEEDDADDSVLAAGDKIMAESVLDLAARSFQPARRLRWHYRSQHEDLIAFSNREFYDDDLIVFPASKQPAATLGIEVVQVDGIWRNRTNPEEARAIAASVIDFMRDHPGLSHGVVAMNQPQRELIQAEIDVRSTNDPSVGTYRDRWEDRLEPPFVKNLENVQGDERDVIFISLGWGKTPEGAIHQRFFPVNRREDGHRRLNVLLTRARKKLVLFSSLQPEQIAFDPEKTARGVRVLRDYLLYARDGRLAPGTASGKGPDSPFEQAVAGALRARGHQIEPQVGVAGYFIDMAVRHPTKHASFILGIECDGATYHSAKSARDRDRLRQEALERLGWRLLRVWSTDWFRDHVAEADRLSALIKAAVDADSQNETLEPRLVAPLGLRDDWDASREASVLDPPFELQATTGVATGRAKRPANAYEPPPLFARHDLPAALRRFRDDIVLAEFPGSEPERSILREEMISAIIREQLTDPDDFTAKIPQWLRTRTDGRQMKYLRQICDLVDEYGKAPQN